MAVGWEERPLSWAFELVVFERCSDCLALDSNAPAFAMPLLLRFFSEVGLDDSSVDLLPVDEIAALPLDLSSSSSGPSLAELRVNPPGILPGAAFDLEVVADEDLASLSLEDLVGLVELPNILFSRFPP